MGQPFQCTKCGTLFAAGSVGEQSPAISKCTVCGAELLARKSSQDPAPSKKGDFWLWTSNFGGPLLWVAAAFALVATTISKFA